MRFPGFELGSFRQHSARLLPNLLRDISPCGALRSSGQIVTRAVASDPKRLQASRLWSHSVPAVNTAMGSRKPGSSGQGCGFTNILDIARDVALDESMPYNQSQPSKPVDAYDGRAWLLSLVQFRYPCLFMSWSARVQGRSNGMYTAVTSRMPEILCFLRYFDLDQSGKPGVPGTHPRCDVDDYPCISVRQNRKSSCISERKAIRRTARRKFQYRNTRGPCRLDHRKATP